MRTGEENIVVPLDSLERPPATSYAAVRSSSPACLSVTWAPLSAAAAEAGASLGRTVCWAAGAVSWATPVRFAGRRFFGPAQQRP